MINNISLVLIPLVLFASVQANDLCPALKETACKENNSCKWVQTSEVQCQQAVECENLTEEVCYGNPTACKWGGAKESSCTVNSTYCSDATNCDLKYCQLNKETAATCKRKGNGFGCGAIKDEGSCTNQCQWANSYCSVNHQTCEVSTPFHLCDNNPNCISQIDSCILKSDAVSTCLAITDSITCKENGCDFKDNLCSAPSQCSKPLPGQPCSAICDAGAKRCLTREGVCNLTAEASCKGNSSCNWIATPICYDVPTFCDNAASCDSNYCILTPALPPTCAPNPVGECGIIKDQTTCQNNQLCTFNQAVAPFCYNQEGNCRIFGVENQCNVQSGCSWQHVSVCQTDASYSYLLSSAIALMSIVLLI